MEWRQRGDFWDGVCDLTGHILCLGLSGSIGKHGEDIELGSLGPRWIWALHICAIHICKDEKVSWRLPSVTEGRRPQGHPHWIAVCLSFGRIRARKLRGQTSLLGQEKLQPPVGIGPAASTPGPLPLCQQVEACPPASSGPLQHRPGFCLLSITLACGRLRRNPGKTEQ